MQSPGSNRDASSESGESRQLEHVCVHAGQSDQSQRPNRHTWDNEGRISSRTYPIIRPLSPTETNSYGYQYDPVGRLSGLTQPYCGFSAQDGSACYQWGTNTLTTASYGPASELTSLSYYGYSETFSYNSLLQLTRQTVPGVFDMQYNFPAGQNNGQISSSVEYVSGEQVNYTYDALKRLTAASTTGPQWGQTFSYDGFGNLTAKTVTKGAGANWAQAYDPSTNHAIANPGLTYDANGNQYNANQNQSFDTENRLTSSTTFGYWYDPSGKRVLQTTGGSPNTWILYFYDIFGKPIESLSGDANYPNSSNTLSANIYFGGRLLVSNGVPVVTDRLGSVRANANRERFSYLPYGEEETPTANGRAKFGTYVRDLSTLDYADQRYYDSWWGRFKSADPSGAKAADPSNPTSWNMYAYTQGDPINHSDPTGTFDDGPSLMAPPDWGYGGGGACLPVGWGSNEWLNGSLGEVFGGGCGSPCGNSFLPNPNCGYQGPTPAPDPGPVSPPPPECFAQLKTRPVDDPTAQKFDATHSFWYVQDETGTQYVVSGGPTGPGSGYLNVGISKNVTTGVDNVSAHTSWDSGLSSGICDKVDNLLGAARSFPNNSIQYQPIHGPNSNSVAKYLGRAGGFYPPPPAGSYGWNYPLFGPEGP